MKNVERQWLESWLKDKKLKLESIHMKQQINTAIYEAERKMLMSDIDSLEKQLAGYK